MCSGIEYQEHKVYFPQPNAKLPVLKKNGEVYWVEWGNRDTGRDLLPNGGWARLDSIGSGKWKPWHPRPVIIPVDSFMEKDEERNSHWIPVDSPMVIQGLLAERNKQLRVYVVTVDTPPEYAWIHDRFPRLVKHEVSKVNS